MSRKLTGRMLAVLLAVVMAAGLLPVSALAARVIHDDAPVAEVAVGDEVAKTAVKPAKAAEVEETETEAGTETGEEQPVPVPDPEAPAGCKYYPLQTKMLTVKGHDKKNNVPGNMLDGLYWTQWVANWGFGGEGEESHSAEDNWIQITLPQAVKVQGLRYQARYDEPHRGYASGGFGGWKLETSEDGDTWTNIAAGNWGVEGTPENETGDATYEGTYYKPESSEWYDAWLDEAVETRYIRLTATQLYAYEEGNKNYGSCAEIRLVVTEEAEVPTEVAYDCELAKDGPVDGGVYAIFTNRNNVSREEELTQNALLTYSGTGDVTDQVEAGAISDDNDRQYLDLSHDRTFHPVETQLWQAIETEDGWLLKSLAGNRNKYLELSLDGGNAHAHAKVNRAPQTLTVEAATKDNSYKVLCQDGDKCCSLNWDSGGYYTHDADNGFALRFYEWKGGEIKTETVEEPEEPGTEPENPGEEPENPGEEPENPGTEPEEPGDNTGDDTPATPSTPTTPSRPTTKPVTPSTEPEEELEDEDVPLVERPMQFEDVTEDDWFYEGVKYNFNNDLMRGTSETRFAPHLDTTRGMIVTILHRAEGEPEAEPTSFADVKDGMWYTDGIAWGQAEDIARGLENGTNFGPAMNVTREQMAAFLHRYAKYKGYDVTASGALEDFTDGGNTSRWAVEDVRWAIGAGLIEGKGNHILDPKGTATRGEVALILMRFRENFMK